MMLIVAGRKARPFPLGYSTKLVSRDARDALRFGGCLHFAGDDDRAAFAFWERPPVVTIRIQQVPLPEQVSRVSGILNSSVRSRRPKACLPSDMKGGEEIRSHI